MPQPHLIVVRLDQPRDSIGCPNNPLLVTPVIEQFHQEDLT